VAQSSEGKIPMMTAGRNQSSYRLTLAFFVVFSLAFVVAASAAAPSYKERLDRKEQREKEAAAAMEAQIADILPPDGQPTADVAPLYAQLRETGNNNAVSLCYAIALHALSADRIEEAIRVLDAAFARLEASSAGDESAEKARGKFHAEEEKSFRGEPYEQVMIYLLRGLLYMREGDFENARAVFRSGALRDRSALDAKEEEQYQDDLAEMDYLEALCDLKLGDAKAEDAFKFAHDHARAEDAILEPAGDFNSVVIFLSGVGPSKYRTGKYNQFLRFSPGSGASGPLRVLVNDNPCSEVSGPVDSMTFQATTRGGREIDAVLKGKAQFKSGASFAGDIALAASAGALAAASSAAPGQDSSGAAAASAALGLVGLVAKGISAAANPEADIRMLSPLHDDIYIVPAKLGDGSNRVIFECPETGIRSEHSLVCAQKPCDIHLVWDAAFGAQVERVRRAKFGAAELAESMTHGMAWQGEAAFEGLKEKVALALVANGEVEESWTGYAKLGSDVCPCTGAIDKKNFRASFRETSDLADVTRQYILLGKSKRSGKRLEGTVFYVRDSGMLPVGSFKMKSIATDKD